LFNVLKKNIAELSKDYLFELNDEFTQRRFVAAVEPFLQDVQSNRGITDFKVVADESVNTAEVIDRNEFVGKIFIKPARSINFIRLDFVAVKSGVSFTEVAGV
jgi:phage tail sheath protein FI